MNESLRTVAKLAVLLDKADRPIYAIDDRRQIAYCNRALTDWLQLDADQVIGRRVEFHSEPADRSIGGGEYTTAALTDLCPPPQVFHGVEATATVSCVDRSGRLSHRRAQFVTLKNNATAVEHTDDSAEIGNGISILAILESSDLTPAELSQALANEPATDVLHKQIRQFRHSQVGRYAPDTLLGRSPSMQKVRAQVHAAAASGANVLIIGRPGAGLARIAKSAHYAASQGAAIPLVTLDGNLITDDLLHRNLDSLRRASDAHRRGTLLITNIDQPTTEQQLELVRWFGNSGLQVRIMGTLIEHRPNRNDGSQVSIGDREDVPQLTLEARLHDLVSTIVIRVPPLVERLDDLPILVQFYLEAKNQNHAKQVGSVTAEALDRLALYSWPGELNELQDVIHRAHDACQGHTITESDLLPVVHHAVQAALSSRRKTETIVLDDFLSRIERQLISRAMRQAAGNKTEAARLLGVTRPRLYRRLEQIGWAEGGAEDKSS